MIGKPLSASVFLTFCLALLLSSPSQAAAPPGGISCTASGIFASCTKSSSECPPGTVPYCSAGFLGLNVVCTCSGAASALQSHLSVSQASEIAYDGYVRFLTTLASEEARNTAAAAAVMMDAARANDSDAYSEAAAIHEESLRKLPEGELEQVYEFLKVPNP